MSYEQTVFTTGLRKTRRVRIGSVVIGAGSPIAIQSMCATKTTDTSATLAQIRLLQDAGAELIRVAVDSKRDVEALKAIRAETDANLVVDLQENYRLAQDVAPFVQKLRYNPGHLYHHQPELAIGDKVGFLVDIAGRYNCALRIGINFGSLDPATSSSQKPAQAALNTALEHVELVEKKGFQDVVVSLKSSDPLAVIYLNRQFSERCPSVPIHLGVTEAGMLPDGEIKTRIALEPLLSAGIGDTIRVSLTVPNSKKDQEVIVAKKILEDVRLGRFTAPAEVNKNKLNVISCPSCSRVENRAFVQLAQEVKAAMKFAEDEKLTIAVMGCRVNGPGETDHADLGLWCAPSFVNLKREGQLLGQFSYEEVVARLVTEVKDLLARRKAS